MTTIDYQVKCPDDIWWFCAILVNNLFLHVCMCWRCSMVHKIVVRLFALSFLFDFFIASSRCIEEILSECSFPPVVLHAEIDKKSGTGKEGIFTIFTQSENFVPYPSPKHRWRSHFRFFCFMFSNFVRANCTVSQHPVSLNKTKTRHKFVSRNQVYNVQRECLSWDRKLPFCSVSQMTGKKDPCLALVEQFFDRTDILLDISSRDMGVIVLRLSNLEFFVNGLMTDRGDRDTIWSLSFRSTWV